MWLHRAAVKVWSSVRLGSWTGEFQGTIDKREAGVLSFLWRCWLKKPKGARGCCFAYTGMFWLNMELGVCKSKPHSNLISNKTSGEWAGTTLHAMFEGIGVCIFLLWDSLNTDSIGSDKKTCWKSWLKCQPFKGQIFVLSPVADSHNRRIIRPSGGMEWGKLAASAPSVLGKNRSTEMFPSLVNRSRILLTSGASEAGQDQCLAWNYKASCITVATTVNSHEIWDSC